jgi:mannose-6-phosphate isomerase-like protein (cupin superfamily)
LTTPQQAAGILTRSRRKEGIMELKSTLQVFNESDLPSSPGVVQGQTVKWLAGNAEHPSERIGAILASFKPGVLEHLHWHLTEAFHYIISGRAILRDIEGNSYDIGPGSVVYAPPGLLGSHEWEVIEELRLISIKGTTDPERIIQFTVDKSTKESKVELDYLIKCGAADLKKSLY